MPEKTRFPSRRFYGEAMQAPIHSMLIQRDIQNQMLDQAGYRGRRVMGFKLPPWQRPEVWTDDQAKSFIQSIWMGVGLGAYMVNHSTRDPECDLVLLDGQQRLTAIERYINGDFALQGDDGNAYHWTELSDQERSHFLRIPFPWLQTNYTEQHQLQEAYNRHNFGGTLHSPDQFVTIDPQPCVAQLRP